MKIGQRRQKSVAVEVTSNLQLTTAGQVLRQISQGLSNAWIQSGGSRSKRRLVSWNHWWVGARLVGGRERVPSKRCQRAKLAASIEPGPTVAAMRRTSDIRTRLAIQYTLRWRQHVCCSALVVLVVFSLPGTRASRARPPPLLSEDSLCVAYALSLQPC